MSSSNALLIGLVLAVAGGALLFFVFFWSILAIVLNVVILYLVAMRVYFKYRQRDVTHYIIGLAAGAVFVLLFGRLLPFWRLTDIAVLGTIIAEVIYWLPRSWTGRSRPRKRGRRRR